MAISERRREMKRRRKRLKERRKALQKEKRRVQVLSPPRGGEGGKGKEKPAREGG